MLSRLLLKSSDILSNVLHKVDFAEYLKRNTNLHLVFYHGVGNGTSPCFASLNDEVSLETFEKQINYLQKNYAIRPMEESICEFNSNTCRDNIPTCSISFDDGLASVYTKAFPILKGRGLTAAVFLNTSVIGNTKLLWTHLLSFLIYNCGLNVIRKMIGDTIDYEYKYIPADNRQFIGWCKANYGLIHRAKSLQILIDKLRIDVKTVAEKEKLYLTLQEINFMSKYGFTFYSHTASHLPLNTLSDNEMQKEIDESLKFMEIHGIGSKQYVSFPFGMKKDYGDRAKEYALSAGHEYILEVGDGFNSKIRGTVNKAYSRVSLGTCSADAKELFSTLEIRPRLKAVVNGVRPFSNIKWR